MKRTETPDKKTSEKVVPVPLYTSPAIRDALKIKAAAKGISLNELVREILTGEKQ